LVVGVSALANNWNPAVVVVTHNRAKELKGTLTALFNLTDVSMFAVYVSMDSPASYTILDNISSSYPIVDVLHQPKCKETQAYGCISAHIAAAFDQVFERNHSHCILLEDDLLVSPDFLTLFRATAFLLDEDPTLWCVSSWNDNGFKVATPKLNELARTDMFPGLGWMIRKEEWTLNLQKKIGRAALPLP